MAKRQFKAESKKLLEMMINSIYTHKEIFLRELISNASDAIDKLYYKGLSDQTIGIQRSDYSIRLDVDPDARTLTISDNGIGMTKEELEKNLGTIAKSGSMEFKNEIFKTLDCVVDRLCETIRKLTDDMVKSITCRQWISNSFLE